MATRTTQSWTPVWKQHEQGDRKQRAFFAELQEIVLIEIGRYLHDVNVEIKIAVQHKPKEPIRTYFVEAGEPPFYTTGVALTVFAAVKWGQGPNKETIKAVWGARRIKPPKAVKKGMLKPSAGSTAKKKMRRRPQA